MNQEKAKNKAKEKPALPFDGLKIETQIKVLQSLTDWYGKNKKPAAYRDIGGVHANKYNVSSTLQFFSKVGWLHEEKSGTFVPCEDLVQYFEGIDQQSGANNLADKIIQAPVGQKLSFFLGQRGKVSEADIISYVGSEFKLKKADATRILKLIELLTVLGALSKEGDEITLRKGEFKPPGLPKTQKIIPVKTITPQTKNQISLFFGVLVDPNTPEEKIRKAIRTALDEINKVMGNEK